MRYRIYYLIPKTLENRAALRTAFAVVVAVLIAFKFHLDRPFWAGMTVVILANVYTGSVINKAILRVIGTLLGSLLGYFLAGLVTNSLLLYLLVNFLLISFAAYYFNFSAHAYAYLLGAISAFFVISQIPIAPSQTFDIAIWRPIEISIGVIVSTIAALFVFPNNTQDSLIKDVDSVFEKIRDLLQELQKLVLAQDYDYQSIYQNNLELKKKLKKSMEMIDFMRLELGISKQRIEQFRTIFSIFYNFTRSINYFLSSYHLQKKKELDFSQMTEAIQRIFKAADEDLEHLKYTLLRGETKTELLKMENLVASWQHKMREQWQKSDSKKSPQLLKTHLVSLPLIEHISHLITQLTQAFIGAKHLKKDDFAIESAQFPLRNNSDLIVNSIKTGLSASIALLLWLGTNWINGITGIISSVIISLKKNIFENRVAVYRLLGCLLGSSVILLPLTFYAMSIYTLVLTLFLTIWCFCYFSFKYPEEGYIGLQANIVIVMFLAQTGGPPTELQPALERLAGIFIGIGSTFLVGSLLWRTDHLAVLGRQLARLYRYLIHNLTQILQPQSHPLFLYDLSRLFWLCRNILEALPEHRFRQKKQVTLRQRQSFFEQLILIQATIIHIRESIDREKAHRTALHYGIDLNPLEVQVVAVYLSKNLDETTALQQQINEFIVQADLTIHYAKSATEELRNCIAYINALHHLNLANRELTRVN